MKLTFTKEFEKQYKNLRVNKQAKVDETLTTFMKDKSVASLRHHELEGEWQGHYSISAGGDLRIHLRYIEIENVLVVTLGAHSQLYK